MLFSEDVLDFSDGISGDHVRWNTHRDMGGRWLTSITARRRFLFASSHPTGIEPAASTRDLAIPTNGPNRTCRGNSSARLGPGPQPFPAAGSPSGTIKLTSRSSALRHGINLTRTTPATRKGTCCEGPLSAFSKSPTRTECPRHAIIVGMTYRTL